MIETQPQRQIPITGVNLILRKGRRLKVPAMIRKPELPLRAGIKLRGIGYVVLQFFRNRIKNAINSDFPIVPPVMDSTSPTCNEGDNIRNSFAPNPEKIQ